MASNENKIELSFSDAELTVLRAEYADLTADEFGAFLAACHRYRLNPLANQIYARLQRQTQKNPRAITYYTQIDGYRLIADRTNRYAGNDDPVFDGVVPAVKGGMGEHPAKATATVYKMVEGQSKAFTASARWSEYCPGGNAAFMWNRMPYLMLGKCSEALALRKAFPAELAGLYVAEELQQSDEQPAEKPAVAKPAAQPAGSRSRNFQRPPGWPDTPAAALVKWVGALQNFTELTVAMAMFEKEPSLTGHAEWELVVKAVGNKYRLLTANFTKFREKEFEQKIKAIFDKFALDKQAAK